MNENDFLVEGQRLYVIEVERIARGTKTYTLRLPENITETQAMSIAQDIACNDTFTTKDADYEFTILRNEPF